MTINKTSRLFIDTRNVLLLFLAIICGIFLFGSTSKASALSGSDFKAGRIIDDAVFYNDNTMSAAQIQTFLNSKVPVCDTNGEKMFNSTQTRAEWAAATGNPEPPYVCLKDYSQNVPTITNGGSDLCKQSISGGTKSAARIIYDVSKACGINPQVLIVLLQKEQSLVTDDWPWPIQYRSATGYGCPDTAPCDSEYYGFFNQVYQAAKAYRRYEANPTFYNYRAGRNNTILWHPNTACGSSTVFIENQATANLYIYTPYRPNQAALNNLRGTGDSCSSYGNRNFWVFFNDWFGSTFGTPFFRIDNEAKVFILGSNDNYYYVSTPSLLLAYGYGVTVNKIVSVSNGYIENKTFSGKLPLTARFEGSEIYLMDKGKRHHFTSGTMLTRYGFSIGEEAMLPLSTQVYYPQSTNIRYVVRDTGNSKLFWLENGNRMHIDGPSAYESGDPPYSFYAIIALSGDFLSSRSAGPRIFAPSTLFRSGSSPKVYIINTGSSSLYIPSPSLMNEFNFKQKNVRSIPTFDASGYPETSSLSSPFIKDSLGNIFLVHSNNKIRPVSSLMADDDYYNLEESTLPILNSKILNSYKKLDGLSELVRSEGDAKVYKVEFGSKRHVTGPSKLADLGYTADDITVVSNYFVTILPEGPSI